MNYTINIALEGKHFFATAPHSITDEQRALRMLRELKDRFPVVEGFEVELTSHETINQTIELEPKEPYNVSELLTYDSNTVGKRLHALIDDLYNMASQSSEPIAYQDVYHNMPSKLPNNERVCRAVSNAVNAKLQMSFIINDIDTQLGV